MNVAGKNTKKLGALGADPIFLISPFEKIPATKLASLYFRDFPSQIGWIRKLRDKKIFYNRMKIPPHIKSHQSIPKHSVNESLFEIRFQGKNRSKMITNFVGVLSKLKHTHMQILKLTNKYCIFDSGR